LDGFSLIESAMTRPIRVIRVLFELAERLTAPIAHELTLQHL